MLETLIVATIVGLLLLGGWAVGAAGHALVLAGIGLATIGFAYGIPTAIVYHWRLYRSLVACGRLPARWWWNPTSLHDRIPTRERPRVLFWGAVGGSGFAVIVLGIGLTAFGLWRTLGA